MKKFSYQLHFTKSPRSPNNDFALLERQSTSRAPPKSLYPESEASKPVPPKNQITGNLLYTETFKNSNLDNSTDLSDFYPEFAKDLSSLYWW